ncbi:nicotinamide-nucleotide amidase [Pilibacter termitis]|uniref:Putative competence-damage inducible protein n=1 Tax=Pilibacter termitis TaxID=263852 RepID=A0A1T4L3B2_9ENTE|nr:competence/damage-inducible protein A [Pilibacter termitis]SJZ49215.1 nicotinamide-nucleotide amidase [Pilibacter termitis]
MKAEILTVGTEILMGQIVNSNAATISELLNDFGIDVVYHTTVGDNFQRMTRALAQAEERVDFIIMCGGLGPTEDDLTKEVLAKHLGEELVQDKAGYQKLLDYFEKTGREHTPNNDLQVLTLKGGEVLKNEVGLAVGSFIEKNGKFYAALPGPPSEMRPMLSNVLLPKLAEKTGANGKLYSRVLRFYGIGESQLVTKLADLINQQTDPTIAPYAKEVEVTLRLATKCKSEQEANEKLEKIKQEILKTEDVGEFFYGEGEYNTLANVTVELLKEKGVTISAAESLTAGMFQSTLCDIVGASEIFKGGFVTYSQETKAEFLGINAEELTQHGTVSEFCAKEMARCAREKSGADIGVSLTGVAGPNTLEGKEAGTVWIGIATKEGVYALEHHFARSRQFVRMNSVMKALSMVHKELLSCS